VEILIGLPESGGRLATEAEMLDTPALVSASAFWNGERFVLPGARVVTVAGRKVREGSRLDGLDVALDSAGYTAMVNPAWGGKYPWTIAQYLELALWLRPRWYSAMDFCVEPQVAADRAEVERRVYETAANLLRTFGLVNQWRMEILGKILETGSDPHAAVQTSLDMCRDPMPILQGWRTDDYRRSISLTGEALSIAARPWPSLIGIGSVCRRELSGPAGVYAVLNAVDQLLPPHVRLHLFGVKGDGMAELAACPRVASVDSCAWDDGLRHDLQQQRRALSRAEGIDIREASKRIPSSEEKRASAMRAWLEGQQRRAETPPTGQVSLFWRVPG